MTNAHPGPDSCYDWNPRSSSVLENHIAATDEMRASCPVAHSQYLGWSVFAHRDVCRVLHDPDSFSNAVSAHVAVPNGMDPPEHGAFRELIEPYFDDRRLRAFEPICRAVATALIEAMPQSGELEVMDSWARDFALKAQCAFMGWPPELEDSLNHWLDKSRRATLSGCPRSLQESAAEFSDLVAGLLSAADSDESADDVTTRLTRETVNGRPLTQVELTSILRNWTVGELGSISAAVGILVAYLAEHETLQQFLRQNPQHLPAAIEEILRLDAPLLTNRRKVTQETTLSSRKLLPGNRVSIMWAAANRDPEAFAQAKSFCLDRDQSKNLLYGAGIHYCPGASLARLELRVFLETLLKATETITLSPSTPLVRAIYPAGGFAQITIRLSR